MPNKSAVSKYAKWLTEHAMSHAELGAYFCRSAGWVTHVAKGNWRNVRVTAEQAALMRAIYEHEQKRARLPRDVNARLTSAQQHLGQAMDDLNWVVHALKRK